MTSLDIHSQKKSLHYSLSTYTEKNMYTKFDEEKQMVLTGFQFIMLIQQFDR